MPSQAILEEIKLLSQFQQDSTAIGIKVHAHEASADLVAAAGRLFEKGFTDHVDGGYLTDRGLHAAELVHELVEMLKN